MSVHLPAGKTKVVIGTRHWLGSEWFHVDGDSSPLVDETGRQYPVDMVADAREIPLPDGCAQFVFSSECLEHFPWATTEAVLSEWIRLVAPGGQIRVEVPDFIGACQQAVAGTTAAEDRAMNQIFGGGQSGPFDFHYAFISHRMLIEWYEEAGLTVENVERGWECGWLRVDGRKP